MILYGNADIYMTGYCIFSQRARAEENGGTYGTETAAHTGGRA